MGHDCFDKLFEIGCLQIRKTVAGYHGAEIASVTGDLLTTAVKTSKTELDSNLGKMEDRASGLIAVLEDRRRLKISSSSSGQSIGSSSVTGQVNECGIPNVGIRTAVWGSKVLPIQEPDIVPRSITVGSAQKLIGKAGIQAFYLLPNQDRVVFLSSSVMNYIGRFFHSSQGLQ